MKKRIRQIAIALLTVLMLAIIGYYAKQMWTKGNFANFWLLTVSAIAGAWISNTFNALKAELRQLRVEIASARHDIHEVNRLLQPQAYYRGR